jgi:glycosyltransferase involved in cell wall biosynthesis
MIERHVAKAGETGTSSVRPLHVSLENIGGSSGPSLVIPEVNRELRSIGVASTMVGLQWPHMPTVPDDEIRRAFPPTGPLKRRGASRAMRDSIFRSIASGTSNLLHCHSIWLMPPVYGASAARRFGCPLVISPHGTLAHWAFTRGSPLKRIAWPLLQRRAVMRADCFHATSPQEAEEIRSHGFRQPIAVIPFGMHVPDEEPVESERERVVLFLSRIHRKKGLDDLLSAWQRLAPTHGHWRLDIAGPIDSEYARQLKRTVTRDAIPRVRFIGEVSGDAKWRAFRTAGVFVLPTQSENFGVAVAESLAAGTPVIVSKGAPWEEVERRGCGWWPDIGPAGLTRALEDAMSRSREELHSMGRAGRAWVRATFDWNVTTRRLADCYAWLLVGGDRPTTIV